MPSGSGGGFCAPIWARFMKRTLDELKLHGEFPKGAGAEASQHSESSDERKPDQSRTRTITVCTVSGGLATPYCPATAERTLKGGQSGPGPCRVHGPAGGRAGGAHNEEGRSVAPDEGGGQTYTVCAKSGQLAGPNCAVTTESTHRPGGTCHSCGRSHEPEPEPKPKSEPTKPATP